MDYRGLWRRLTSVYDEAEAKAVVRYLLEQRFGLTSTDIYCGRVELMGQTKQEELERMMRRMEQAEPVQYVLGETDFCGRQFHVAPGVLIPRPETAELCQWVLVEGGKRKVEGEYNILDIGTGSGCIAITLALDMPNSKVTAWDVSDDALRIASENAQCLHADITFEKHDALDTSTFHRPSSTNSHDIIVSNPPYIKPQESDGMEKNVLEYEPRIALFAPDDNPIIFYQRIGDYAWQSLRPGGQLFFELNPLTADDVKSYLTQQGFQEIELRQDQYGKTRFLKATKI